MSNIIDGYLVYQCIQEIKRSTENSREMTSKTAYINRKRYFLGKTPWALDSQVFQFSFEKTYIYRNLNY